MYSICNAISKISMNGFRMDNLGDLDIIKNVLSGKIDEFALLVDKYQSRIYSAVLNYVYNQEDALDITQEAFLKAYSNLSKFNSSSSFYTWLYRIAINTAIDFIRKRKNKIIDSLDDAKFSEKGFEPISKDTSSDPEIALNNREDQRLLRKCISLLSEKLRTVLVLHDIEGLAQDEIAEILKIPVGTVKSRISRARSDLKNIILSHGGSLR